MYRQNKGICLSHGTFYRYSIICTKLETSGLTQDILYVSLQRERFTVPSIHKQVYKQQPSVWEALNSCKKTAAQTHKQKVAHCKKYTSK